MVHGPLKTAGALTKPKEVVSTGIPFDQTYQTQYLVIWFTHDDNI